MLKGGGNMFGKRKKFILLIFILVILALGRKVLGEKTITIEKEIIDQGVDTKAFIIQKEDVVYFNHANSLDLTIDSAVKVPANSIIGNTNSVVVNNQKAQDLEVVNQKLEDEMYLDSGLFRKDLEKINRELRNIQSKIQEAGEDQALKLQEEKKVLEDKKQRIENSFRYAFADSEHLNQIKDELESNPKTVDGQITPQKLGIQYPSYIFLQKDGWENVLHKDILGNITVEYYNEIEDYMEESNTESNQGNERLLRFVDDSKMYLIAKVAKDAFPSIEERLFKLKQDIDKKWQEKGYTDFYSYIENRKNALKQFPEITIQWENTTIHGFVVDSSENNRQDEKVFTIKLDTQNHKLIGQRQIDIHMYNEKYSGYMLPKNAITEVNGKQGIVLLDQDQEEQFVEIVIKEELEDLIVLDPRENMQLKTGDSILANP